MDDERRAEAALAIAHPRRSVAAAVDLLHLRPGMQVLDAGCGPGVHLGLLAARVLPGGQVVGFDLDADDLAVAGDLWSDANAAQEIVLQEGDAHRLPFSSDAFDVAWSSAVFHHLEEPDVALAELVRVVRPGGTIAILDADNSVSFPALSWPPELEMRVRAAVNRAADENYGGKLDHFFDGYLGRKLTRLLREAGLRDLSLHALSDVDFAPLDARRKRQIRDWFHNWCEERICDYLAPRDRAQFVALFDLESPDSLLNAPDFFLTRTYFLAVGQVA